jgi:hypothetical protein
VARPTIAAPTTTRTTAVATTQNTLTPVLDRRCGGLVCGSVLLVLTGGAMLNDV